MGEALLAGLRKSGVPASRLRVVEPNLERRKLLREKYGDEIVLFDKLIDEAARAVDVIVLCVKPQVAALALKGLRPSQQQLVVSVMAGVPLAALQSLLGGTEAKPLPIVRCMPNTAAQVFKSVTVHTHIAGSLSTEQKKRANELLRCLGDTVIEVSDESYIDRATALTGSGPAYVFLILEALVDAGVELGFSRDDSLGMVLQLFEGSIGIARAQPKAHLASLRNAVTSPAGTTAAGLAAMEESGVRSALRNGVLAALKRSEELGKKAMSKL